MGFMTKNNLFLSMDNQPNGQRVRTLIDPRSNQIVSQMPVNSSLRSKALGKRRGQRTLLPRQSQDQYGA